MSKNPKLARKVAKRARRKRSMAATTTKSGILPQATWAPGVGAYSGDYSTKRLGSPEHARAQDDMCLQTLGTLRRAFAKSGSDPDSGMLGFSLGCCWQDATSEDSPMNTLPLVGNDCVLSGHCAHCDGELEVLVGNDPERPGLRRDDLAREYARIDEDEDEDEDFLKEHWLAAPCHTKALTRWQFDPRQGVIILTCAECRAPFVSVQVGADTYGPFTDDLGARLAVAQARPLITRLRP